MFNAILLPYFFWCFADSSASAGLPEAESLKGEAVDSSLGLHEVKSWIDEILEHRQESMENCVYICLLVFIYVCKCLYIDI